MAAAKFTYKKKRFCSLFFISCIHQQLCILVLVVLTNHRFQEMIVHLQTNQAIRDAAVLIPRPSQPKPTAVPKICWYHRQFGQVSTNYIEPCAFTAPDLPPHSPIAKPVIRSAIVMKNLMLQSQANNSPHHPTSSFRIWTKMLRN